MAQDYWGFGSSKEEIIRQIQDLRNKHVGTSWKQFSFIIFIACPNSDRKSNGDPSDKWKRVANQYLAQLKGSQEFSGKQDET